MTAECIQWLRGVVTAVLPGGKVFDDPAVLNQTHPLPHAVIELGDELLNRDGSRVARAVTAGGTSLVHRRRVWSRTVPVTVYLAHKTMAAADQVVQNLLLAVAGGVTTDSGDWVRVRCHGVAWEQVKAATPQRVDCQIDLAFEGGIYRDEGAPLVSQVRVEPDESAGAGAGA